MRTLLVSSTITQGVIYIARPMITYRALELHATPAIVGVIAALYALLPVLFALSFGRWVGRFGEGKFVILGTAAMAISSFALIFADSIFLLAIAAALAGTAHLACMVGGQTMVSLRTPEFQYERYFGLYTFSASLGQMVGPLIAVAVAGSTGIIPKSTTSAFVAALGFSLIALIPIFKWRNDPPTVVAARRDESSLHSAVALIKDPKIFAAIYTSMIISSVGDILIVFLPLYGTEKEFSALWIGAIISIRAGASMLSRFFLGALSNRFTTKKILAVSTIISLSSCALMAAAPNEISLAIIVLIAGLSLGVGQPLTMSLVSQATEPGDRALAVSARLTGNRLGQFIVPAGVGLLATSTGTGAVFLALALLLATTFLPPQS